MIENIQNFIADLPAWLTWLGVIVASALPFVESYFGSAIGVLIGFPAPVAIALASVGNLAAVLGVIYLSASVRERIVARRSGTAKAKPAVSERTERKRAKLRARLERFGVPGVCLLGQTLLPSQFTAAALVSIGAPRNQVALWQAISIVLWGILFGTLVAVGLGAAVGA